MNHTDSGRFDHVPDGEPLDRLVLGRASRTVGATDRLHMATTILVASAVIGFVSETERSTGTSNLTCSLAS